MSARGSLHRHAWRTIVRAASLLVPAGERADWRREWDAELHHVQARGGPVLRTALGAFADALEVGIGPRAFADAARFGAASLGRAPAHVAGAAVVLATGISAAGVCLALAWPAATKAVDGGSASAVLLAFSIPLVLALVASSAAAASCLIRRAVARHRNTVPCTADEARAATMVLCAAAGIAGLLLAAAATWRFPDAAAGWSLLDGAARVLGPILLPGTIAAAAVRRWAVSLIDHP
jgi:hypothetical protein